MRGRAQAAVEPRRIRHARARRDARLPLAVEPRPHQRTDGVDRRDRVRVLEVVERVTKRRREHHRARRAGLVVVVDDLRVPLAVQDLVDVLALDDARHVEVAVVVVARVLVVEHGNAHVPALHVPVGHQIHAVRVDEGAQLDHVAQEPQRLLVGAAHHLVDVLDELLRADRFGGVEAAVDPDDRPAFLRERPRLVVGQPFGVGQLADDLLVACEPRVVLGRRDDGHHHRPAFGGLADVHHVDAGRFLLQLLPVLHGLLVVRDEVVVADVVPPFLQRGRDARGGRLRRRARRGGRLRRGSGAVERTGQYTSQDHQASTHVSHETYPPVCE